MGLDPCPSTDAYNTRIFCTFTMESYTAVKKKETCRKVDISRKCYVRWGNLAERGKYHMFLLI